MLFEKTMLDTVTSGLAGCVDQWSALFAQATESLDEDEIRLAGLFRAILLERENTVVEATEAFLDEGPDADVVMDLFHCLDELSGVNGELADRAEECRRLVVPRTAA
ncbi:hypothetical protein [Streptomyces acidicola]|uniref:Uncharacterized protein n=1 Tax=Streptomyces acidicola TaxID=2596892 RepID=A0A5N8WYH4_9ACTN|nr:hypothetical protein [Streptomyces acidicola]MPY51774.1 hypothetical protein [Streptomyces acidicola]